MLKKMMLLAMAVGALVAFAAPAQADDWYLDEVKIGEGEESKETVSFTGTMTTIKGPVRTVCAVHTDTTIWNIFIGAFSWIDEDEKTAPCTVAVNVGGGTYVDVCEVDEVITEGFPWNVNIATGTNGIDIEGYNFSHKFKGCLSTLGIPDGTKLGAAGTLTGTWNNTGGCMEFNNSGDLKDPGGNPVTVSGSICNSSVTLT
jgi:hypothetical protein